MPSRWRDTGWGDLQVLEPVSCDLCGVPLTMAPSRDDGQVLCAPCDRATPVRRPPGPREGPDPAPPVLEDVARPVGCCPLCGGLGYRSITVDHEPDPRSLGTRPILERVDCEECGGTGSRKEPTT